MLGGQAARSTTSYHDRSRTGAQGAHTLGRYQEALDCNTHALEIMDCGTAQDMRKAILRHLDQAQQPQA
jgi:hypothetical protein